MKKRLKVISENRLILVMIFVFYSIQTFNILTFNGC